MGISTFNEIPMLLVENSGYEYDQTVDPPRGLNRARTLSTESIPDVIVIEIVILLP